MHPTKVGAAPVSAGAAPVEAPQRTVTKATSYRHPTTEAVSGHASDTSHRDDGLGAARGLALAILFDLVLVAVIVGACYLVGFLLAHPLYFVAVVCVAVLAIMVTADRWMS